MYNSREFLLLELFRALPLKVVWGRNSFREIGPNYVVRFEMSVSWLLLTCVIYLSQVMILTEKWHTGEKKILSNLSSSCVLFWMKEERWLDLLLAQECAVFLLQYFNNILSVFQNKHKIPHLCLLFPFPKPALQNKASDKTTYVLYLNGLSSWHLYQISIHRKCRGLGLWKPARLLPFLGEIPHCPLSVVLDLKILPKNKCFFLWC